MEKYDTECKEITIVNLYEKLEFLTKKPLYIKSFISWSEHNIISDILDITFNIGPHVKGGGGIHQYANGSALQTVRQHVITSFITNKNKHIKLLTSNL